MILSVSTLRLDGIFEAGYLSPRGNPSSVAHRNGGRLVICMTYIYNIIHYLLVLIHTYPVKKSIILIPKYYSDDITHKSKNHISCNYIYISMM